MPSALHFLAAQRRVTPTQAQFPQDQRVPDAQEETWTERPRVPGTRPLRVPQGPGCASPFPGPVEAHSHRTTGSVTSVMPPATPAPLNLQKKKYMYVYNRVTMLYTQNEHNSVSNYTPVNKLNNVFVRK